MDHRLCGQVAQDKELLLDTCAGAFATKKACLQVPEHVSLSRCEKDSTSFQNVLLSMVEVYEKQILNPEFEIAGSEEAVETSEVFMKEIEALLSGKGLMAGVCHDLFLCRRLLYI